MKHAHWILLLCTVAVAPVQAADDGPSIDIVTASPQQWHFWHVKVEHTDSGYSVTGRMNAPLRFGLPRGHVDLAAYSADGKRLAETTARFFPPILTRFVQRRGGVYFSANLQGAIPGDGIIKVAFHRQKVEPFSPPAHDLNVAR